MIIKTQALSLHELGKRTNQEDSLFPDKGREQYSSDLYILCDGMGGHEKGEVASSTVCSAMSAEIIGKGHSLKKPFREEDFNSALEAAYDALEKQDDDSEKKMGTTLTFLKFHPGGCLAAHIGDSRIYQVRPSEKRILFKTRDHSLVNDLVAIGEITEEEAKTHRQKNVITRAIQPGQERRSTADIANLEDILPGDYFLMCSDGILEQMTDENVVNILSMDCDDEKKREIFRSVTVENKDNHTAHIIRVTDVQNEQNEEKVSSDETPVSPFDVSSGDESPEVSNSSLTNEESVPVAGKKRNILPYIVVIILVVLVVGFLLLNPFSKGRKTPAYDRDRTEQVISSQEKAAKKRVAKARKQAEKSNTGRSSGSSR